jgi:hypothetical protein
MRFFHPIMSWEYVGGPRAVGARRGHQCWGFPVSLKQRYGMGWHLSVRGSSQCLPGFESGFPCVQSMQGQTPQKSISRCVWSLQGLGSMGTWLAVSCIFQTRAVAPSPPVFSDPCLVLHLCLPTGRTFIKASTAFQSTEEAASGSKRGVGWR